MNSRNTIFQVFAFLLFTGAQVTVFMNLALFNTSFCFIYIGFILFLPIDTDRIVLIILGFASGLSVDMFYDSTGIHAAAAVLLAFARPYWVAILTPQGGYEIGVSPTLNQMSFFWVTSYLIPLLVIHHFAIFYIEAGGFSLFFFTLVKVLLSVVFTYVVLLLIQLLFFRR